MRPLLLTALLLLLLAPAAAADRRGTPETGAAAVTLTTREISARELLRNPVVRRDKPEFERFAEVRGRRIDGFDAQVSRDLVTVKRERPTNADKRPNPRAPARADGANRQPGSRAASRAAVTGPFAFDGPSLAAGGAFPPDTQGDVGPEQFFATLNNRFVTYSRETGQPDGVINVDPDTFWAPVMTPIGGAISTNFTSDPRIRYDRLTGRWFAVMIDVPDGGSEENRILVAVSSDGVITPATTWSYFFMDVGEANEFADYPTLGLDANALYIGTNNFTTGASSFDNASLFVVRKSSILGAGPIVFTRFTDVISANSTIGGPFTPQGVDNADPAATTGWFVGVDNYSFGELTLYRVGDPAGTPTLSGVLALTVPATSFPIKVPHLGNTGGSNGNLDALDDRLYAAVLRGGRIWTAHNLGMNATGAAVTSGATRTGTRWYEIDVSGTAPALAQSGSVFDPAAVTPRSFFIPSIAVDGRGVAALGGTVAGAAAPVDAWFTGRLATDPAGVTDAVTQSTASSAAYNPPGDPGGTGGRRWGDYSLTRVDPLDDLTLWTIQEYVTATNTWGTRVVRLQAPAPAAPASAAPSAVTAGGAPVQVSFGGGNGYFDPGAGFARRPSAELLGCPGVTLSGLAVTGTSSFSATVDPAAATAAATCGVRFTNPDGQAVEAPGLLSVALPPPPPPSPTPAPSVVATPVPTPVPTVTPSRTTRRCVVPRLKGLTLKRARARLKKAGCRTGRVTRVRSRAVKRRRVVSSVPRAGRRVALNTKVRLRIRR